jgi:hypothetical protein
VTVKRAKRPIDDRAGHCRGTRPLWNRAWQGGQGAQLTAPACPVFGTVARAAIITNLPVPEFCPESTGR